MRIVIDMQGAQTENRFHDIGRSTMSFAKAVVRNRGDHEIILALNDLLPDAIESIRAAFEGILPQRNICVWNALSHVQEKCSDNEVRHKTAELIREAFLANLRPDVIHISSLFEGYDNDAVISIGQFDKITPVTVSVFDLPCLQKDVAHKLWFQRKMEMLLLADSCFVMTTKTEEKEINLSGSSCKLHKIMISEDHEWDAAACQVIETLCASVQSRLKKDAEEKKRIGNISSQRLRLAFVSPLPPERTGIADYSSELLPVLAKFYDIEVVVAQDRVDDPWVNLHQMPVRDAAWLREHAGEIDRVLYHIGNSPFHHHMLSLLQEVPGVVVLHDFYLGHLFSWIESNGIDAYWTKALYSSHGYRAVRERFRSPQSAVFDFPGCFDVIRHAKGIIVHSKYAKNMAAQWYGENVSTSFEVINLLRSPAGTFDKEDAKKKLNLNKDDFVICSFGFLGRTKLNHRLLKCWLESQLARDRRCRLFFVGENNKSDYGKTLLQTICSSDHADHISITGFVSPEIFRLYLMAADAAVQLRVDSRGETSAAVLDCMNHALPLIINAHGSLAELNYEAVWMLPDEFDDAALIEALETLWRDSERRHVLGVHAREIILSQHDPTICAKHYEEAIERFYSIVRTKEASLISAIAPHFFTTPDDLTLQHISRSIDITITEEKYINRILLDVTVIAKHDYKTGIQRVIRSIMSELIDNQKINYRVEPVRLSNESNAWYYRQAAEFTLNSFGCPVNVISEDLIEPRNGDIILVLDLNAATLARTAKYDFYRKYRNRGVFVYAIVYDILPITMPEVFPPNMQQTHEDWAQAISDFDGAICISKTVADSFATWRSKSAILPTDRRPYNIHWFHLGADISNSIPSFGLSNNVELLLSQLHSCPSFLMVGTVEPRKGYLQAIEAFTKLWYDGINVNLVIVGKEGWKNLPNDMRRNIPCTIERLKNHCELNNHLFWLESISDECLEKIYAASTCLIAASYDEGFGLPLIEAAQHKLPILARDIPVFREVAGEHAYYFRANDGIELAETLKNWLRLYADRRVPLSTGMPYLTWKQSAEWLLSHLTSNIK